MGISWPLNKYSEVEIVISGRPGVGRMLVALFFSTMGATCLVPLAFSIYLSATSKEAIPWIGVYLFASAGVAIFAVVIALLMYRKSILIDPVSKMVTERRSWGPIARKRIPIADVSMIWIDHATRTVRSTRNSPSTPRSWTVCVMSLISTSGAALELLDWPDSSVRFRDLVRAEPDYESLIREAAAELSKRTGWKVDDRLPVVEPKLVAPRSEPPRQAIAPGKATIRLPDGDAKYTPRRSVEPHKVSIHLPAWIRQPAPRPARRNPESVRLSRLIWAGLLVPILAGAGSVAFGLWDYHCLKTATGRIDGYWETKAWGNGIYYRFDTNGKSYGAWAWNPPAQIWANRKTDVLVYVVYLPRDPNRSSLVTPSVEVIWPYWKTVAYLSPYSVFLFLAFAALRRRRQRIEKSMQLARIGAITLGSLMQPVRRASRGKITMHINGIRLGRQYKTPDEDPNQTRYEFIANGLPQSGYVPVNLLGFLPRDGIIAVLFDPDRPEVHMPLRAIERYVCAA